MARIGSGRSGGCRTCRRRHIKCDENYPACDRCTKVGYNCEGYVREHRFVDETPRVEKKQARRRGGGPRNDVSLADDTPLAPSSTDTMSYIPSPKLHSDDAKSSIGPKDLISKSNCENSANVLPRLSLSLSAFEDNIHTTFLLTHLFSGHSSGATPWLLNHVLDASSPTVLASARALSTVYFGRMHHLPTLVSHGSEIYISALHHLNYDLRDRSKLSELRVLRSAVVLELFEFIAFSDKRGWMKHAGGVGRLIELQGPRAFQHPENRYLLEGNRVTIALECLIKRQKCFLAQPKWKSIPWAKEPGSKTSSLMLHDHLCDLPGLMEDADLLLGLAMRDKEWDKRYKELKNTTMMCLKSLWGWRAKLEGENPGVCVEAATSWTGSEALFPTVLCFSSLQLANEITVYNAILLLLLRLCYQVLDQDSISCIPALASHIPKPVLPSRCPLLFPGSEGSTNPQALAIEICRSVEFHMRSENIGAGAFFLLFPLRLAYQSFERGCRESKWLEEVMAKLADLSGFEIGRNLGGRTELMTAS